MTTTTIAIIGAGFCGATLAVHLLRRPPAVPLRIVLINRSGAMARGVAYGTRVSAHVLNVPAGRMGALVGEEDGFYEYARRHDQALSPGDFVARRVYGDYLEALLDQAVAQARPGVELHSVVGEVHRIVPHDDGEGARLLMDDGVCFEADRVILSIGNYCRRNPCTGQAGQPFYDSPLYVQDPWVPGALRTIGAYDPVLLVGSGLTMVDVVLDLRNRGHRGHIHAISRRGLAPQTHRHLDAPPAYDDRLAQRMLATRSMRHYVRAVRDAVRAHALAGGDWRDVIGGLRADTPRLWQALPACERRRFLRHVRPYWDNHRHRCAPQPGARLQAEIDRGTLTLFAGRILRYELNHVGVGVFLRRRGARAQERIDVASVINCTTPALDLHDSGNPLLDALLADGLLVPDALGLGLQVDEGGALVDRAGVASRCLYYVGPLLQGRDWEATAVPELRGHVQRLAERLQGL